MTRQFFLPIRKYRELKLAPVVGIGIDHSLKFYIRARLFKTNNVVS